MKTTTETNKGTPNRMNIETRMMGQKLMDEARKGNVKLTDHYWGSQLSWESGRYDVLHFRQGFGGMKVYKSDRVFARDLAGCDSVAALTDLLHPECDLAAGDPQHYTPRDVQPVELTWSPK